MKTVIVRLGIEIDGREYALTSEINPYGKVNEASIRQAIDAILNPHHSVIDEVPDYPGLLKLPETEQAIKEWNDNGRAK